jgi:hypothetical protein
LSRIEDGLERIFRLLQALCHITLSTPLLLAQAPLPGTDVTVIRSTLNLTRRSIRTFRFLDSFATAHTIYTRAFSSSSSSLTFEAYLDVLRLTLLGMYGLLESATLPDMAGVELFGAKRAAELNFEAQRFWFFALVCGVLGGASKLVNFYAYAPVPETGAGYGVAAAKDDEVDEKGRKKGAEVTEEKKSEDVKERKAELEREKEVRGAMASKALKKVTADALDAVLPLAAMGWVDFDPTIVGWAMLVTTVLTGQDVWERCGTQVRKASAGKA